MVAAKITAIAVIVISLIIGVISFYIMSENPKIKKKKQMEEMISQLINFIIFIWLGKILVNITIFIKDPLAILAYPSGSYAFYLAVLFSALTLAYKAVRKQMDVIGFIQSFIPVFLVASFVYEFIQIVWQDNTYSTWYVALLAILLILFQLIKDRIATGISTMVILICWSAGMVTLTFIQPFVTVFGYIMEPWFIGLFFIASFILLIERRRRNGWN